MASDERHPLPPVPSPDATVSEVDQYLKDVFIALLFTPDEAEIQAKRLRCTGEGLYQLKEAAWTEAYGPQGYVIYNHLQNSLYGAKGGIWQILSVVVRVLAAVTAFSACELVWKKESPGKSATFLVCSITTVVITILYYICGLPYVVNRKWLWERIKVRSPTATRL